jgi:hypothetical protein
MHLQFIYMYNLSYMFQQIFTTLRETMTKKNVRLQENA